MSCRKHCQNTKLIIDYTDNTVIMSNANYADKIVQHITLSVDCADKTVQHITLNVDYAVNTVIIYN